MGTILRQKLTTTTSQLSIPRTLYIIMGHAIGPELLYLSNQHRLEGQSAARGVTAGCFEIQSKQGAWC